MKVEKLNEEKDFLLLTQLRIPPESNGVEVVDQNLCVPSNETLQILSIYIVSENLFHVAKLLIRCA